MALFGFGIKLGSLAFKSAISTFELELNAAKMLSLLILGLKLKQRFFVGSLSFF